MRAEFCASCPADVWMELVASISLFITFSNETLAILVNNSSTFSPANNTQTSMHWYTMNYILSAFTTELDPHVWEFKYHYLSCNSNDTCIYFHNDTCIYWLQWTLRTLQSKVTSMHRTRLLQAQMLYLCTSWNQDTIFCTVSVWNNREVPLYIYLSLRKWTSILLWNPLHTLQRSSPSFSVPHHPPSEHRLCSYTCTLYVCIHIHMICYSILCCWCNINGLTTKSFLVETRNMLNSDVQNSCASRSHDLR